MIKGVLNLSAVHLNLAFLDEVDSWAYHSFSDQTHIAIYVFILEGGTDCWNQFVICFKSEFRIKE